MAIATPREQGQRRGDPGAADTAPPTRCLPPGPRLPRLAQTLVWALAPNVLLDQCARRLGDTFTLTFFPSGLQFVIVSDPDAVKTVFTAPPEIAPSGARNSPIAPALGASSVLVLTGPEHMRQRKLLLPPFHGERMREYEDVIVAATRRDMASWPPERPMRLLDRTRRITLEVILQAVFGVEGQEMESLKQAIDRLLEETQSRRMVLLALSRPSLERPGGRIGAALDNLDDLLYQEIARRRGEGDLAERKDILSLLLGARDEDGEAMTDSELRDELVTLLLAGHETTATSVAWAIERLVRHPLALSRLQAEIDAGDSEDYLMAVVHETMRVRPVVPIVVRLLEQELRVGDRTLPPGTRVVPSIYLTNRNPRIYEDASEFRPERYLESAPETFSWIPFGGGIRRCIGAAFATLEMKLMLRTMLEQHEPRLPPDARRWRRGEWSRRRAVTLVPVAGARVSWHRRSPGRSDG